MRNAPLRFVLVLSLSAYTPSSFAQEVPPSGGEVPRIPGVPQSIWDTIPDEQKETMEEYGGAYYFKAIHLGGSREVIENTPTGMAYGYGWGEVAKAQSLTAAAVFPINHTAFVWGGVNHVWAWWALDRGEDTVNAPVAVGIASVIGEVTAESDAMLIASSGAAFSQGEGWIFGPETSDETHIKVTSSSFLMGQADPKANQAPHSKAKLLNHTAEWSVTAYSQAQAFSAADVPTGGFGRSRSHATANYKLRTLGGHQILGSSD